MLALVLSAVLLAEPSPPPLVPIEADVPQAPPLVQVSSAQVAKKQQHQRRKVVLIGAGAAVFGLSYGTSAIVAATAEGLKRFPGQVTQLWPLFIPFAGPVIAMFTSRPSDTGVTTFLAFDALTQLGGVAMVIVGAAMKDESSAPRVWLVPVVNATTVGANFGIHF